MVSATEELRSATRRPHSNGSRLVPPGRQRSVPLAVVGVLLCFFGAMVFGALHLRLDHRVAVLTVARPIGAGDIIHDGDLRVARVSASGLATVAADDRAAVVGHVAAVSLAPGSLLVRSDLGSPTSLQSGQAVVGVALKAGQLPGVVRPGDRVLIVDTGAAGTADAAGAPSTSAASRVQATVAAVNEPPDSPGVTIVSLTVGADDAPAIATAAAAGHVTLVLLPSAP
jgi:hypothetical protein